MSAMIIASFLLTKLEVPVLVEAALQNFAAGLIIAAGKELISFSMPLSHIHC